MMFSYRFGAYLERPMVLFESEMSGRSASMVSYQLDGRTAHT